MSITNTHKWISVDQALQRILDVLENELLTAETKVLKIKDEITNIKNDRVNIREAMLGVNSQSELSTETLKVMKEREIKGF